MILWKTHQNNQVCPNFLVWACRFGISLPVSCFWMPLFSLLPKCVNLSIFSFDFFSVSPAPCRQNQSQFAPPHLLSPLLHFSPCSYYSSCSCSCSCSCCCCSCCCAAVLISVTGSPTITLAGKLSATVS